MGHQALQCIGMTPLNEFKKLLPEDMNLNDEDTETLRDLMDAQADLILDSYLRDKANGKI